MVREAKQQLEARHGKKMKARQKKDREREVNVQDGYCKGSVNMDDVNTFY